jgi:hypothetical protein
MVQNEIPSTEPVKKLKCDICKKKIRVIYPYECRCKGVFCKDHLFFNKHSCTFDYRTLYKCEEKIVHIKVEQI